MFEKSGGGMKKLKDRLLLIGAALLLIVVVGSTYLLAEKFHVDPTWVMWASISLGIFAVFGWDYRDQFRSKGFLFFVGWLLIHVLLFALLVGFSWFCGLGCFPN